VSVDSATVPTRPLQLESVEEHGARVVAERLGIPFVVFRDGERRQKIVTLSAQDERVAVGRRPERGIHLHWDPEVSRVHALLERLAGAWTIIDEGLSRNGTFVNDCRVHGRRRLNDGDLVRCGTVVLEFRDPGHPADAATIRAKNAEARTTQLTDQQKRVLAALCRPLAETPHAVPATNKQIAGELCLSVDAVKTHLRRAAEVLAVDGLPQNQKRAALAWRALEAGVIKQAELLVDR
jgi:pSer/pThr/pTyr-binding forkhead associated (FHA) protein